jgi:hypothetical protein
MAMPVSQGYFTALHSVQIAHFVEAIYRRKKAQKPQKRIFVFSVPLCGRLVVAPPRCDSCAFSWLFQLRLLG